MMIIDNTFLYLLSKDLQVFYIKEWNFPKFLTILFSLHSSRKYDKEIM